MKNMKILGIVVVAVIALALAIAAVQLDGMPQEKEPIRIGSILILSGEGAAWGQASRNGIDMAVEKINAEGGINGRIMAVDYQDDQGDPKKALAAFTALVDGKGVNIIIGPSWSRTGLLLSDLADQKHVLMISPTLGVKEFNEKSRYLFNTWPHDFLLSEKLAEYVFQKGHRRVALIGAQEVWVKDQANAFTRRFKELGGSIEVLVEPDPATRDVYTEALKIKDNKDITAIISITDGVLVGTLVAKRARELGSDLPIYSVTIDADIIQASQGVYEGMEFLTSLTPTKEFQEAYEKKYSKPIEIGADSSYDAIMLLAQAARITGTTDTTVLQSYLNGYVSEYDGVSGHLKSDGKGGFTKPYVLMKVINGTATKVG